MYLCRRCRRPILFGRVLSLTHIPMRRTHNMVLGIEYECDCGPVQRHLYVYDKPAVVQLCGAFVLTLPYYAAGSGGWPVLTQEDASAAAEHDRNMELVSTPADMFGPAEAS